MNTTSSTERSLLKFLLLLIALSVPLWVLGSIFEIELFPGFYLYQLPLGMPSVAALILIYRERGKAGVISLLKRTYDFRNIRSKIWYVPILFLSPIVGLINYTILYFTGVPVPSLQFSSVILLGYSMVFFMTYGEELGLTGYLIDPLQERYSALKSGLIVGFIWAAYHIPGFVISGFYTIEWMFWHALYTIATRIIFVWVYNNSGKSMFSMALFHWTFGIFWILFPPTGNLQKATPYYDPQICSLTVLFFASIVTFLWGPRTLAHYRFSTAENSKG
ncbi:hypothetical protein CH373_06230 [Leptospira perolatii]|uniref:CAAX prenyl protease 2/Lysostaphin resistance protein A-like domain-containing protein n=1 Tax=Leptospira perolatii TaxID=2023191 RepID=A0A2M9ZNU5_9LEPT|nr:CPBP family intramembrane glutamic endopeptidase [Leptospira perolatii]PJZ70862.1 hypothetical protein CH360_04960 [Leptospira perolatii]PJZ73758.1 hypothetical protein CH373_06230 [Leptospira perolatii]